MKTRVLIGVFAFCLGSTAIAQSPQQVPPMPTQSPPDPNAQAMPGPLNVPPNSRPASPVPHDPMAPPGAPGNPVTVGGNTASPPSAQESYPICKGDVQDRCISPREAPHHAKKKAMKHRR